MKLVYPTIPLDTIKGVLIDIDDTLYLYEPAHQAALQACYQLLLEKPGIYLTFADFAKLYRAHRHAVTLRLNFQGACRSRLLAFQAMFEELEISKAFTHALEHEKTYWGIFLSNIVVEKEALNFLQQCKAVGVLVCAVSDMQAHIQIQKLQCLQVDHLIDFLVTSEEVGIEKPAASMFNSALDKLNLSAAEVIMLGDSWDKDIVGAKALGIKGFKVNIQL